MAERRVPRIRFKGFEEDWEQRKFSDLYEKSSEKNDGSIGVDRNITVASMQFKTDVRVNTVEYLKTYYTFRLGDIAFEGHQSKEFRFGRFVENDIGDGIVSHIFVVFRPVGHYDLRYWKYAINNEKLMQHVLSRSTKASTMMHDLVEKDFLNESLLVPSFKEQQSIGEFLFFVDRSISLHQRKLEKLKILKKAMLEKMFPKNGAKVPEIRFSGFTEDWEQRKFSELVLIERGGSPRPIDNYITDAPDGLNWVKIGDAPAQGRYIFKTAEKIRPQGLSKTRQVQPGDLILSNSMSFGKPYIMGIHGCIHDGWLLIRDTGAKFDSKFLCHLLGSNQMLEQYRMFAAGSTVNNLNKELVGNTTVHIPVIQEQRVIGESLESIDKCISLHQRKLEKLRQIKKSMLERMFV